MPSNLLLLLPLLGGYLFIHLCYSTRFRAQALSGHRLIFEAAVAGFLAVVPAHFMVTVISKSARGDTLAALWRDLTAGAVPATLLMALLLAPVGALIWNLTIFAWRGFQEGIWSEETKAWSKAKTLVYTGRAASMERALAQQGDALQSFLFEATRRAQKALELVLLTMKNRKVYCGLVIGAPNLQPDGQYVQLLPVYSGYRDGDDLRIDLHLEYPYELAFSGDFEFERSEFVIVLPVEEITDARFFDDFMSEAYARSRVSGSKQAG